MPTRGPVENQITQLSCAQLARFRAWFATHKDATLRGAAEADDAAARLEHLTQEALAVARQIPATGGACGLPRSGSAR